MQTGTALALTQLTAEPGKWRWSQPQIWVHANMHAHSHACTCMCAHTRTEKGCKACIEECVSYGWLEGSWAENISWKRWRRTEVQRRLVHLGNWKKRSLGLQEEESGPERDCEGGQSLEVIPTRFVFVLKARRDH